MNDEVQQLRLELLQVRLDAKQKDMGVTERGFALYLGLDPAGYWRIKRGGRPWGRLALERVRQRYPELVPDVLLEGARLLGPGVKAFREQGKRTTKIA